MSARVLLLVIFLSVTIPSLAARQWGAPTGPNLVANPSFEEVGEDGNPVGWYLPPVYSLDSEHARTGERSLKFVNDDPERYLLCRQRIYLVPGKRYDIRAWVRSEGITGQDTGATICVEWSDANGDWLGGYYPSGRKGDTPGWEQVGGTTGRIPEEAASFVIQCYVRRGMTGTAWWDDVSVRLVPQRPLATALLRPSYRGWITDDGPAEIEVRAEVIADDLDAPAEVLQLVGRVLGDGGTVIAEQRWPVVADNPQILRMPLPELAPGDYRLLVELSDTQARRTIAVDEYRLIRREGPMPHSYIDQHNRLIIDGEPFFPLGMYWGRISEEELQRYAEAPFNCLMPYGSPNREEMDLAQRYGLKVIYSIKDFYFGSRYCPRAIASEADEEPAVRERVRQYRDHPALLAWYLNDELPLTYLPRLEAHQQWVEEEDPDHPTWVVLYQVRDVASYLRTFDVIGTDPYPIPYRPVSMAAEWTVLTREAVGDARALWMVPQAFNWGAVRDDREYRPPTRDEMRSMTWQCICEGADGLVYYSWHNLRRDESAPFEERWEDLKAVVSEVAEMIPVLLSVEPVPEVTVEGDPAIHWTVRSLKGTNWLIMVNDAPEVANATVSFARPPERVRVAGAELAVTDGDLTVEFAPLEVKFLSWSTPLAGTG